MDDTRLVKKARDSQPNTKRSIGRPGRGGVIAGRTVFMEQDRVLTRKLRKNTIVSPLHDKPLQYF